VQNRVLFEDNHLIAINKANGELMQPANGELKSVEEDLKQFIKVKYNKPGNVFLGVIHRLDRPVSGCVLLARTGKALARMNEQFKQRAPEKVYHALVRGIPDITEARLEHYLRRDTKKNMSKVVAVSSSDSKLAALSYKLIGRSSSFSLLEIKLETGRHHQIRAQLSAMNMPVLGDLKYGDKRSLPDGGIALHAYSLAFTHPVTESSVSIYAPYPNQPHWNLFNAG
jgi:23S rRNA pseudouridine1911/1915/1917 synthase